MKLTPVDYDPFAIGGDGATVTPGLPIPGPLPEPSLKGYLATEEGFTLAVVVAGVLLYIIVRKLFILVWERRKSINWGYLPAIIILLMLLFPPVHYANKSVPYVGYSDRPISLSVNHGYHGLKFVFLFAIPRGSSINTSLLMMQWLCVVLVSGIVWLASRKPK